MIEYILYHFSGLKVVKDSSAELYNPTERSTIGRQMKAHKNALSHLKEVNTIYISHNGHQSNFYAEPVIYNFKQKYFSELELISYKLVHNK